MFLEIHMLQNFAPSNLNRDDTNSPKDCTFGGVRRARISSQCLKRAIREESKFKEGVHGLVGTRTKLVHQELVAQLVAKGRSEQGALVCVERAFDAVGFKWDGEKGRTSVLLFVGPDEVSTWAQVIDAHWDKLNVAKAAPAADSKKTAKQAKQDNKKDLDTAVTKALKEAMKSTTVGAVDIALFGRMVAENTDMNVDAACQVAHAISTHAVSMEMDFFTAVDDLQPKEDTGAGMMGVVEYNSACFYRYAQINLDQLAKNLGGNQALVRDAVIAFCKSAIVAIPSGKQNSFAAQNRPDWVKIELRSEGSPRSLVNAFAKPIRVSSVRDQDDLIGLSIKAIDAYTAGLDAMYADGSPDFSGVASTHKVEKPLTVPALLTELEAELSKAQATQAKAQA